ncbi:hypothetical protein ACQVP2_25550 [Methylobacterium aquaticum]|uniref:hypothetical protein n=1 Tax=Methylobacterium aquaticum TaxID=270351 RepID=UPI003D1861FF
MRLCLGGSDIRPQITPGVLEAMSRWTAPRRATSKGSEPALIAPGQVGDPEPSAKDRRFGMADAVRMARARPAICGAQTGGSEWSVAMSLTVQAAMPEPRGIVPMPDRSTLAQCQRMPRLAGHALRARFPSGGGASPAALVCRLIKTANPESLPRLSMSSRCKN